MRATDEQDRLFSFRPPSCRNHHHVLPTLLIGSVFVAVAALGWWLYRCQFSDAEKTLTAWATHNGYTILRKSDATPANEARPQPHSLRVATVRSWTR